MDNLDAIFYGVGAGLEIVKEHLPTKDVHKDEEVSYLRKFYKEAMDFFDEQYLEKLAHKMINKMKKSNNLDFANINELVIEKLDAIPIPTSPQIVKINKKILETNPKLATTKLAHIIHYRAVSKALEEIQGLELNYKRFKLNGGNRNFFLAGVRAGLEPIYGLSIIYIIRNKIIDRQPEEFGSFNKKYLGFVNKMAVMMNKRLQLTKGLDMPKGELVRLHEMISSLRKGLS